LHITGKSGDSDELGKCTALGQSHIIFVVFGIFCVSLCNKLVPLERISSHGPKLGSFHDWRRFWRTLGPDDGNFI